VVIVGTGKMGEVALRTLERRGVSDVQIVGRTPERVACLAGPTRRAVLLHELASALAAADVVISATAAPHPVITAATLATRPAGRPLVIVDIAVPRDVDPAVRALPGVQVYDIDDLKAVARRYRQERAAEARRAERIVEAEMRRFSAWLRERRAAPSIGAVHRRAEAIRRGEVSRVVQELALDDDQRRVLDAMTSALVKRLLHDPFVRLKAPDGLRLLPVFDELFAARS
jgi:glutamyl-tRNA reductase